MPSEILDCFMEAEGMLREQKWYDEEWTSCAGYWDDLRYSDTIVLKLSRREWSSCFPITLYEGAEIHYAAWVDEKSIGRNEVVFGMHVFAFPMIENPRAKKGDFTDPFRERLGERILGWGHHDVKRGPRVPYGGKYRFESEAELREFLFLDFQRFVSLQEDIDALLAIIRSKWGG